MAWYLCGDPVRAEDLPQHAMLRTYLAWGRLREGDRVAYTRRVLANTRIDIWRKERRESLTAPHAMPEPAAELDVSLGTVKSTASRGLARLRELLAEPAGTMTPSPEGSPR